MVVHLRGGIVSIKINFVTEKTTVEMGLMKLQKRVVRLLILFIYVKNYRFKHTCNDDTDIRRRKQQKLAYHIFTCKFPISSLQCDELLTL